MGRKDGMIWNVLGYGKNYDPIYYMKKLNKIYEKKF